MVLVPGLLCEPGAYLSHGWFIPYWVKESYLFGPKWLIPNSWGCFPFQSNGIRWAQRVALVLVDHSSNILHW